MSNVDPSTTFVITENDLEPSIRGTIYRAATDAELAVAPLITRYPLDCTNAQSVTMILKPATGGAARRITAAFISKPAGTWEHDWVAGETGSAFVGTAKGRVELGWPNTRPQTAPTALDDAFTVIIQSDDG